MIIDIIAAVVRIKIINTVIHIHAELVLVGDSSSVVDCDDEPSSDSWTVPGICSLIIFSRNSALGYNVFVASIEFSLIKML